MGSDLRPSSIGDKRNTPVAASSEPSPTMLPIVLGAVFLVGGVLFAVNPGKTQETPVRPGPKV
jgi:hypothetical protein